MPGNTNLRYHISRLNKNPQHISCRVTFGLVNMNVTPYRFSWTIFIIGLALSYTEKIVGFPMGTNCVPLVADLFLFCYERDFLKNISIDNQVDVIKAVNLTSRYLDNLFNIDNPYFEGMVNQIYPPELQLNKANTSDTEAPFFGFTSVYF